jgi:hypothetical protein
MLGPSFLEELKAAGLKDFRLSWDLNSGEVHYIDGYPEDQIAIVQSVVSSHFYSEVDQAKKIAENEIRAFSSAYIYKKYPPEKQFNIGSDNAFRAFDPPTGPPPPDLVSLYDQTALRTYIDFRNEARARCYMAIAALNSSSIDTLEKVEEFMVELREQYAGEL